MSALAAAAAEESDDEVEVPPLAEPEEGGAKVSKTLQVLELGYPQTNNLRPSPPT